MAATYCDVFKFLWRSIQTINCFFDCFRIHGSHHRTEGVVDKSGFSSLYTAADDEYTMDEGENLIQKIDRSDIDEELLEEAKFLKTCGTIQQTPLEIRKAVSLAETLENSAIQGLQKEIFLSDEISDEIEQGELRPKSMETLDSCIYSTLLESSPETPEEIQKFEASAGSSGKSDSQRSCGSGGSSDKSDSRRACVALRSSPYPTPIKLTDDMQTPGTVFATNMKSLAQGNARIRSQYVYTVLNPIENLNNQQDSDKFIQHESPVHEEHFSEQGSITPYSVVGSTSIVESSQKENIGNLSLSSWLKPPLAHHNHGGAINGKPNIGRNPEDKPIIGLVSYCWNEQEEAPSVSPKWWNGNGIPNTTTKYKEDQKVRWHATPFEDRLARVLPEKASAPQRKSITGRPLVFDETEELDTSSVMDF